MKTFLIALVLVFVTGTTIVRADGFEDVRKRADTLSEELNNVLVPQKSSEKTHEEKQGKDVRSKNDPNRNFVSRESCTKHTEGGRTWESCMKRYLEWESVPFFPKQ